MADDKRTILCVDDEPDVVDSLADTFMESYLVKTANSGQEALKIFLEEDISLIISDQRMPEMEGTELLAKVNSIKPICKKILLTGYSDINAAIDAINTGQVDKYLSKPWDDKELISVVDELLSDIETDEFIARMTGDVQNFKEKMRDAAVSAELYGRFLDNFSPGVCIIGKNEAVEYVNSAGLKLLQCSNSESVMGRPMNDVFSMDTPLRERLLERHKDKSLTLSDLEVKLQDGTTAAVRANATFADDGSEIVGIVFTA